MRSAEDVRRQAAIAGFSEIAEDLARLARTALVLDAEAGVGHVGRLGGLPRLPPGEVDRPGGGEETALYDYDSGGERQGQTTRGGQDPGSRSYRKGASGTVIGLEGQTGAVATNERYQYKPYGELENAAGTMSAAAQSNPFRFQGFYYDSGIKTYDMRARPYRPDLGRFLVQDRFESARGDLNLQSDALTQNRYAFAGGNPVSRVEWDGHAPNRHEAWFCSDEKNSIAWAGIYAASRKASRAVDRMFPPAPGRKRPAVPTASSMASGSH